MPCSAQLFHMLLNEWVFLCLPYMFSFNLNSHNSQQYVQSTTPCMFLYISPYCTLLFPYVLLNGGHYGWILLEVGVEIFSWHNLLKKSGNGYSAISFSAGQPAHICNQSLLLCVYRRVWWLYFIVFQCEVGEAAPPRGNPPQLWLYTSNTHDL